METKKVQKEVLKLLKLFDDVCRENDIEYCLAAGSVLGAVRHKGFIPWDDDLDVVVPKEKIETLRNLLELKIKNTKIKLCKWDVEKSYAETVDRLTLKKLDHEELHLDIFPLIGAPKSKIKRFIFTNVIYYSYRLLRCKNCNTKYSKPNHVKKILFLRKFVKFIPDKLIIKWYKYLENKYPLSKSEYCYILASGYGYKESIKKEVFLDTIEVPFEDMVVNIPKENIFYLKTLYGEDYMTPKRDGYKKIDKQRSRCKK